MRRTLALIAALCFIACAVSAQAPSRSAASRKPDVLSLEQKTKISQLITRQTAPLGNPSLPIPAGGIVPADVQLHPLPADAERVAPQLRGYGYIIVEELVAIAGGFCAYAALTAAAMFRVKEPSAPQVT